MKKLLYVLIGIVIVAVVANLLIPTVNSTKDLKHIKYTETFNQKESDYLVYFYGEDCLYCQQFGPELIETYNGNNLPIYVVDAYADENADVWYDWATHDKNYNKVIGKVESGIEVLNEGESRDKYPANEGWKIEEHDGEVVAELTIAKNNRQPQNAEELEISGSPAMLWIKDGKLQAYGEGIDEARTILSDFQK